MRHVFSKSFTVLCLFFIVGYVFSAPVGRSPYKNDEEHFAYKLDENNVPVDPDCRIQTLWKNVRINSVTTSGIPSKTLEKITVVKFHWAGAWIAWTDNDGYHEPNKKDYIPWKHFPNEISEYYAQYCLPEWKREVSFRHPFSTRTPQYDGKGRLIKRKYGTLIKRRGVTGLLCPEVFNNVYIPFSEFPPQVRKFVGFWENEAYIPEMPVLERTPSNINDDILFLNASEFRIVRRFYDGIRAQAVFHDGQKIVKKDIFIAKTKSKLRPNHKSDLHIMRDNQLHNICQKCDLSDHTSGRYFNYMFDRQVRTACPVKHDEYALKKVGTKKIGKEEIPKYEYIKDYDKTNDPDSVRLQKAAAATI